MKFLVAQILHFATHRTSRINFLALLRFIALLVGLVAVYSILFHVIMEYEGRTESWVTGVYWTLTVMSTLGFGDITFQSDLGRIFSSIVLLTGIIFLLILLPFTFIEFFYEPWMRAQQAARAPTSLPTKTRKHVILIHFDPVIKTLIDKLVQYQHPYVLIVPDLEEALRLHDRGYKVMRGDLDKPETYQLARVENALLVAATANDQLNTNVAATVREVCEQVQIVTTANYHASVDILELAGSNHVLQLGEMMGQALARRVSDGETLAHIIGQFDDLLIAEAMVRDTPLVGKTLTESRLRETTGVHVIGLWERGTFEAARPEMLIEPETVLVMAGSPTHIARYNALLEPSSPPVTPVMIIGGGRVGKATGKALAARGLDYRIIEKMDDRIRNKTHYIHGDAAEIEVLEQAGIRDAATVIITTHDDDMNIYLTIYIRRLRPDVQIISRSGLERNIPTLHRSGADFVLSYASTGANAILNLIGRDNILMVAEGLDVFEVEIPNALEGKTIAESEIRDKTGCTVVAFRRNGRMETAFDPYQPLPKDTRIILVGTPEAEKRFLERYKPE
jgi:Trk K+ transport system NAD-binding subunit